MLCQYQQTLQLQFRSFYICLLFSRRQSSAHNSATIKFYGQEAGKQPYRYSNKMACSLTRTEKPFSVFVHPLWREYYRAAIALNNAAVNLLFCGFYQQGVETIQASIILMMDIAECQDVVAASDVSEAGIRRRLEWAWERVAACMEQSAKNTPGAQQLTREGPIAMKVVSSVYNPALIYAAHATYTNNSNVMFPMTINCIDSNSWESDEDGDHWADIDFHSSVLLYNYGIAHDCLAATTTTDSSNGCNERMALQFKAYSINQLASALLCNQFMNGSSADFFAIGGLLQLETFLTCNLIRICVQLDLAHQDHVRNLEEILLLIGARERMLPTTEHDCARAA